MTGQEQGGSAQGAEDPLNATASSSTDPAASILQDDAQEITSKTGIWSLVNLRKEIRNAVSDIRMQISPTQGRVNAARVIYSILQFIRCNHSCRVILLKRCGECGVGGCICV